MATDLERAFMFLKPMRVKLGGLLDLRVRCVLGVLLIQCCSWMAPVHAQAQNQNPPQPPIPTNSYATKTIRIVSGSIPGTSTDIGARLFSPALGERLGQSIIVDNRPGAGGLLALQNIIASKPDGMSLVITAANHSIGAAIRKVTPFDAVGDFTWISTIATYPMVIAVSPNSSIKSMDDLVNYAKQNPGRVSFSSVGIGTAHHLIGEWLNAELGLEMVHIPYKGSPGALVDVLSGQVDVMIDTATFALQQVKQGKLRALAVSTKKPSDDFPGVPTLNQTIPGFEYESWIALAGPKGMSAEVVQQINQELRVVLATPEIKKRFADIGAVSVASTSQELKQSVEVDILRWKKVIDSRKIPLQ